MKKTFLLFLLSLMSIVTRAGENDSYITPSIALLHQDAIELNLAFEKQMRYHRGFELNTQIYHKFENGNDVENYSIGAAYKFLLHRHRNSLLRFKTGVDVGTGNDEFFCGTNIGIEYNYTFKDRVQIFVYQKNEIVFFADETFRLGIVIGIRIPLHK